MNMKLEFRYLRQVCLARAWVILGVWSVTSPVYGQPDEYGLLVGLAKLEGQDYVAERDRLLMLHPDAWDLEVATRVCWDAALAGLILNARLEDPDGFQKWDAARLMESHAGGSYRYFEDTRLTRAGCLAFRIERLWKPEAFPDTLGKYIMNAPHVKDGSAHLSVPDAVWRAVWAEAEIEELRRIAIQLVAGQSSPVARDMVWEALKSDNVTSQCKQAAFAGLEATRPPYATELLSHVLEDRAIDDGVVAWAAATLGRLDPEGMHPRLLDLARDQTRGSQTRCAALGLLAQHPQPQDTAVFAEAMSQTTAAEVQKWAAMWAKEYPTDQMRAALRGLVRHAADFEAAQEAIRSLVAIGRPDDLEFLRALSGDEAVAAEVRREATNALRAKQWRDERKANRPPRP
jgi:hypothetical protein